MDLTWRPLTERDVPMWADVIADCTAADGSDSRVGVSELTGLLASGVLTPETNSIAVLDGGRMAAYGFIPVRPPARPVHELSIIGRVHPDWRGRGLGGELLDWMVRRGTRIHAERFAHLPLEVRVLTEDDNTVFQDLLVSKGFRPIRQHWQMAADLADVPPPTPLPAGVRLVDYADRHDELARVTVNEVFQHHFGNLVISAQEWRERFTGNEIFRPKVSPLVFDGDRLVAFVLSFEHEGAAVSELELGDVGTRPEWRGRGLATALVGHVLSRARGLGYERAVLLVDSRNDTGAIKVYERVGFRVAGSRTIYALNG
jgi:mycothiol synthase